MNYEAELYQAFDSDPEPVVEFLKWLVLHNQLPATPRVLDVGCGPGRMFRPLAQLGWHVTGIEPNKAFFECAVREAKQFEFSVEQAGFNDIADQAEYDLICGINSSFAHVLTPEARADAFKRAYRALRPGGVLFLDLPNLLRILMEYAGPGEFTATVRGHSARLIRQHEIDYHRAVFTTNEEYSYADETGEQQFKKEHPYAIASYPELSYLLRRAGFSCPNTYSSYASREEEPIRGWRMLIVAKKSK